MIDGGDGADEVMFIGSETDYSLLSNFSMTENLNFVENNSDDEKVLYHISGNETFRLNNIEKIGFTEEEVTVLPENSNDYVNSELISLPILDLSNFNVINTGEGDDVVLGGLGSDYVDTQGGADKVSLGDGSDYVVISGESLESPVEVSTGLGEDIISIESFEGKQF